MKKTKKAKKAKTKKTEKTERVSLNARISADVMAEARGAVFLVPGLKFTDLIEQALVSRLCALRRRYNDGKPFPPKERIIR